MQNKNKNNLIWRISKKKFKQFLKQIFNNLIRWKLE
jgi:hypothetical protein